MAEVNHYRTYRVQSKWRQRLIQRLSSENEDHSTFEISVGKHLQELRIEQGLSQRALAELSGLNFNTLSLIENEKTSPNVSTLRQLANALNIPISSFFEEKREIDRIIYQKAGDRHKTAFAQGQIEDLGGGMALGEATPLLLVLNPHEAGDIDPISHSGQEFVYCLEGQLTVTIDEDNYFLESGDSLIFDAHLPHHCRNIGNSICRSILVISPSDIDDRAVIRHLAE